MLWRHTPSIQPLLLDILQVSRAMVITVPRLGRSRAFTKWPPKWHFHPTFHHLIKHQAHVSAQPHAGGFVKQLDCNPQRARTTFHFPSGRPFSLWTWNQCPHSINTWGGRCGMQDVIWNTSSDPLLRVQWWMKCKSELILSPPHKSNNSLPSLPNAFKFLQGFVCLKHFLAMETRGPWYSALHGGTLCSRPTEAIKSTQEPKSFEMAWIKNYPRPWAGGG